MSKKVSPCASAAAPWLTSPRSAGMEDATSRRAPVATCVPSLARPRSDQRRRRRELHAAGAGSRVAEAAFSHLLET
jgi:hypothetical protein